MPEPNLLDSALARIRSKSAQFAEKASEVSAMIEHVDAHLRDIPGKIPVTVGDKRVKIGVDRDSDWGIWLVDEDSEPSALEPSDVPLRESLTGVAIKRKVRAFPLVLQLLDEIEAEQERQLGEIDAAGQLILKRLAEGK
jgi:hypothetical protein